MSKTSHLTSLKRPLIKSRTFYRLQVKIKVYGSAQILPFSSPFLPIRGLTHSEFLREVFLALSDEWVAAYVFSCNAPSQSFLQLRQATKKSKWRFNSLKSEKLWLCSCHKCTIRHNTCNCFLLAKTSEQCHDQREKK